MKPIVACPTCAAASEFSPENPWRPFCSQRCRLIDLGAWANESYRIPVKPEAEDAPKADENPDE